jgi:hypothetical protein
MPKIPADLNEEQQQTVVAIFDSESALTSSETILQHLAWSQLKTVHAGKKSLQIRSQSK